MQISVLGCGWLGFPLAKSLLENGYQINGSTTSEAKVPILTQAGIRPFVFKIGENDASEDRIIAKFLQQSRFLILNVPPGIRANPESRFSEKIAKLIPLIANHGIRTVYFISSTSVYADAIPIASSDSLKYSDSIAASELLEAENMLIENRNFNTTIIRFGGLIGSDRHPVKYLAGKQLLSNPDAPVNLIQQLDCIGIIRFLLQKKIETGIFDGVFPLHPTRENYYTEKANEFKLLLPEFAKSESAGKIVQPDNLLALGYKFKYPI